MKLIIFLSILVLFSCKNIVSDNSQSDISSTYHPGMSNSDVSLPQSFTMSLVGVSDQEITVNWTTSSLANSYKVVYGSASGDYTTTYSSSATSPITLSGLTNGDTYYIRIIAQNVNGDTQSTQEIHAMPMTPPNTPTSLSVDSASSHTINLAWTNEGGLGTIKYNILRSTTSNSGYSIVASDVTTHSYSDTGLTTGETYYYVIVAKNEGGNSSYSNEVSATVP